MIGDNSLVKDVIDIRAKRALNKRATLGANMMKQSPTKSHTKKSYSVSSFGAQKFNFGKKEKNYKGTEQVLSD